MTRDERVPFVVWLALADTLSLTLVILRESLLGMRRELDGGLWPRQLVSSLHQRLVLLDWTI